MTVAIGPQPQVTTLEELVPLIWEQLNAIASEFYYFQLQKVNAAPVRPQDGQLAYADGTDWNPGSGRGAYMYDAGTASWRHLG